MLWTASSDSTLRTVSGSSAGEPGSASRSTMPNGEAANLASGGVAPVRAYIDRLLPGVLDGSVDPGAVFDATMTLDQAPEAYRAMDDRAALKVLLRG